MNKWKAKTRRGLYGPKKVYEKSFCGFMLMVFKSSPGRYVWSVKGRNKTISGVHFRPRIGVEPHILKAASHAHVAALALKG